MDFITVTDAFWSTQAGALAGALRFAVQVCGNAVLEGTKHVLVTIRPDSSTGSFCGERCAAIVSILNDDSVPSLVIQNVTVTEPAFVSRTLLLTVKASHPPPLAVSVNFNTRDGTARVATLCKSQLRICPDYAAASGTLTLPAGTTSGTVSLTILPDSQTEPDETFSVVLSNPVNATINSAIGTVTIRDEFLSVGGFSVNQDSDRASVGEVHTVGVDWIVPPHLVWRALDTIDLRIRGAGGDGSFLRWSETANSFSVCRHGYGTGQDDDDGKGKGKGKGGGATRFGAICGPAVQPGSFSTLQIGRQAQLDLSRTSAVGSGPLGQSVLLDLALSFLPKTAGHQLTLELAAADDFGNEDRFVPAASVKVDKRR